MLGLDDELYKKYSALIREKVGIEYGAAQKNVLNNRLMPLLMAHKIDDFHDYFNLLLTDTSGAAMSEFIAKVTTNHTYFYREKSHFEFLENDVFPQQEKELKAGTKKDLRYWVAASSTGEEPYTLAMMLHNYFCRRGLCRASVLATDISRNVVEKATRGVYRKSDVEKLPKLYTDQYFKKVDERLYGVSDEIREMVLFRVLNLIRDKFPFQNQFDVIFIRNVMIYFDDPTRQKLISQLHDLLVPGGYLFIGQTETLQIKIRNFKQVFPSVYRKGFENEN